MNNSLWGKWGENSNLDKLETPMARKLVSELSPVMGAISLGKK